MTRIQNRTGEETPKISGSGVCGETLLNGPHPTEKVGHPAGASLSILRAPITQVELTPLENIWAPLVPRPKAGRRLRESREVGLAGLQGAGRWRCNC